MSRLSGRVWELGGMTFLVNHNGVAFEKDIGLRTARIAERMTTFNTDQNWKKAAVSAP